MMVMTSVSDRPVTEPAGTTGAIVALRAARRVRDSPPPCSSCAAGPVRLATAGRVRRPGGRSASSGRWGGRVPGKPVGLSNDPDMAVVQLEAGRLGLAHELMIVRGDHDRGAEPVELDEQPQQATPHLRVDV